MTELFQLTVSPGRRNRPVESGEPFRVGEEVHFVFPLRTITEAIVSTTPLRVATTPSSAPIAVVVLEVVGYVSPSACSARKPSA